MFGLPGQILCVFLMSKKMISMLFTLPFTCLTFFGFGGFGLFLWEDYCFVLGSQPQIQLLSPVNTLDKEVASQNHIRPDTTLQIKGHKKSARPPGCMKLYTLTPKLW
jgi:hypothetical protein